MTDKTKFRIALGIIILLVVAFFYKGCKARKDKDEFYNLNKVMNDTISYYTNKDGKQVARISTLETANVEDFLRIKTQQADILKLQSVVEKYKKQIKNQGSATIIDTESNYGESTATGGSVITGSETISQERYVALPYFYRNRDTTWISLDFRIDKDTTSFKVRTKDSYSVVIGEESQGLFKKPKPFVDVISENPYSAVKSLRTYKVSAPASKNLHIGPGVFYGVGTDFKAQVFIGAGIMWTPLNF